ncbi:lipid scramblase CLPTM1L-like isoform X2 [Paramormyrops kingsleyae]|uniref:lipid scramblase CLPTM1L-like isoform X2 n=1 Tax=Paramormyrops kingsleyae TaxID=1676925 RepID=UPI003B96C370
MLPACRFASPGGTSLRSLLAGLFAVYVVHASWFMYSFIYTKPCEISKSNLCIPSYLAEKPRLQLSIYTSLHPDAGGEQKLLLKVDDFDIRSKFERQVNVSLPGKGFMDGTLYALVFLHRAGVPISQDPMEVHHVVQLTNHMLVKPASQETLQAGESDAAQSVSLWRPRLVLRVMSEDIPLDTAAPPTDLRRYLKTHQNGKKMLYLPLLFVNELANRVQDMMEIKSITPEVPLSISYEDISLWRLRLWIRIQDAVNSLRKLGFSERDLDEIKSIFVDPNLSYLALAGLVASVHFLSDILALKNDIGLWKKERNRAGVSNPAALRECCCGLVVLLSMLDDGQTSPLVLLPAAASFAIEVSGQSLCSCTLYTEKHNVIHQVLSHGLSIAGDNGGAGLVPPPNGIGAPWVPPFSLALSDVNHRPHGYPNVHLRYSCNFSSSQNCMNIHES